MSKTYYGSHHFLQVMFAEYHLITYLNILYDIENATNLLNKYEGKGRDGFYGWNGLNGTVLMWFDHYDTV